MSYNCYRTNQFKIKLAHRYSISHSGEWYAAEFKSERHIIARSSAPPNYFEHRHKQTFLYIDSEQLFSRRLK